MTVLRKYTQEAPASYEADPLYIRMQTIRDLLDEYDQDELLSLEADLHGQIEAWRTEYNVESPEQLRERAANSSSVATTHEIRQTGNDWALVRYRLAIVEAAIGNCAIYTRVG